MTVGAHPMNWRALALATFSFAFSFAAWGLIGGLAPLFSDLYKLSGPQTALLVGVPVVRGSLAPLPMGMLTDRFGGRAMFTILLAASAVAAWVVTLTNTYEALAGPALSFRLPWSPV